MNPMRLMEELFPICRSLTGDGFLKSLEIISKHMDLTILEYPTGQKCYDWQIPEEWNIRDAYIKNDKGNRLVDFKKNNLHVVGYSTPLHQKMSSEEVKNHLYSLPDMPEAIPYVTSYYKKRWGFCVTHKVYEELTKDPSAEYEVCIDSDLKNGVLRIGEWFLPGETDKEILLSTYLCHPSLANDNLSGPSVAITLAEKIKKTPKRRYSYRILFLPETIGSIAYLSTHEEQIKKIYGGYVLTCLGDKGPFNYKKTFQGGHEIDQAAALVLENSNHKHKIRDFWPNGSDERQYCSAGLRLPVGSLMRTPYLEYPEYHTSLDNLGFVSEKALNDSVEIYHQVLQYLEMNQTYKANFKCEPMLEKYGMYVSYQTDKERAWGTLYFLSMSDGQHSLMDIHKKSKIPMKILNEIAIKAHENGLVSKA